MAIEKNSVVSMFYELKDANTNEVLESNLYAQPISFILGKGQILEALEEEVMKLDCPSNADVVIKKDKGWANTMKMQCKFYQKSNLQALI